MGADAAREGTERQLEREGFELVATTEDLADGQLLGVETSRGERVCLLRWRGEIHAVQDECTHAEFAMSDGLLLPDGRLQCVWHGAEFDCRTGAVRRGPATDPLPVYPVRVAGGRVYVGPRGDR